MNFPNLEKNTDNQPSIKLFEQEVNSNKAQISLEKSKKNYQINRRCLLQTLNKRLQTQDSYNGVYGQFGVALLFNSNIKKQTKKH
jgi:cobalt-zinc-cadmium resistance protein CzcA